MAEGSALRVKAGDAVRVHYHPPGQVMSFVEGVVSRVSVTSTQGSGFLIDITRDVFLGREQPVRLGYQHYVLDERPDGFSEQVELLAQVQSEAAGHLENGLEPDVAQGIEQEPVTEAVPHPEPKPLTKAEQETVPDTDANESPIKVDHQDGQRRGRRIISIFGRRRK